MSASHTFSDLTVETDHATHGGASDSGDRSGAPTPLGGTRPPMLRWQLGWLESVVDRAEATLVALRSGERRYNGRTLDECSSTTDALMWYANVAGLLQGDLETVVKSARDAIAAGREVTR